LSKKSSKKLKITFSVSAIVAVLLALGAGIWLHQRGADVFDTVLKWILGLSTGIVIFGLFGWVVWKTFGRNSKFIKKR